MKPKLVLLRHGQSEWNKTNRFTGWTDVGLTPEGEQEAHEASRLLLDAGYTFDRCLTSYLKRAVKTLWIVLEDMDLMWLPVARHWRLNERHYGALQGLNKAETAAEHGEEQVFTWRRSFDVPPPPLKPEDPRFPGREAKYGNIPEEQLPVGESLHMTVKRVIPYWHNVIAPAIVRGQRLLVCAHGNSLRALVKYLDKVSDEDIPLLNIPTGIPLVYELDDRLRAKKHYYLGDAEKAEKAAQAVAAQGKKKG